MSEQLYAPPWSLPSESGGVLDQLLEGCIRGEETSYLHVYNLYAAPIYRLCFSLLRHREDAEEVLQDTFEYAFRKLENYDSSRASFKTWLYQIAVSRCRNKRRRKVLDLIPLSAIFDSRKAENKDDSPERLAQLSEQQQQVWDALSQLSDKLRETAILRYYENLTYAEIGQVLSIPSKTAESRMRLAHAQLKRLLDHAEFDAAQEANKE